MKEMVLKISVDPIARKLEIVWADAEHSAFHYVWLRHSARCPHGMPNDTSIKIDLLPDDPTALVIESFRVDGGELAIDWGGEGLTTRHGLDILRAAAYDDAARQRRKHRPLLWDRDSADTVARFDYAEIQSDRGRLDLLLAVRDCGLARLGGVPAEPGTVADIAASFGPMHVNNYGGIFDVRSDARRNLGSNTGHGLPPHTDESYRHEAPGISFFHCLQAAPEGGESVMVDGFRVAQELRETDSRAFDTLTRVPLYFQRLALPGEDMRSHTRVLVTDVDGDVVGVRWTDRTLPPQDLPDALVEPVYRALRAFWKIVNAGEMQVCYRLEPGDLHVFDNHRVLHGRRAFDAGHPRHLQQCSVNRDEFHNSLRTLALKLGDPASELVMAGGAVG